jgi:hypothetical protein
MERLRRLQQASAIFEGCTEDGEGGTKIAKIAGFLRVQSSCATHEGR